MKSSHKVIGPFLNRGRMMTLPDMRSMPAMKIPLFLFFN
jgi:hypothetical protein